MVTCFVIRARLAQISMEDSCAIRGIGCAVEHTVSRVRALIDSGNYGKLSCNHLLNDCTDAEMVFDALNLSGEAYMTVGDVVVWHNGKRELCLTEGWASI